MSPSFLELTDNIFDEQILSADLPILVDFWAEWCGPCKMMEPTLQEISIELADRLRVAKVNVDDSLRTAQRYQVMSIPTLILFAQGEPLVRIVGARPKSSILNDIMPHLRDL
ncbi:MAG: thioredoxin [Actinobacteria bacterium]|nr:thioredoxin [Actinomycetota bacterium]